MDVTRRRALGEPAFGPRPDGVAPMEWVLALLSHLVKYHDAVVTDVDVADASHASFIVKIPDGSAGLRS